MNEMKRSQWYFADLPLMFLCHSDPFSTGVPCILTSQSKICAETKTHFLFDHLEEVIEV